MSLTIRCKGGPYDGDTFIVDKKPVSIFVPELLVKTIAFHKQCSYVYHDTVFGELVYRFVRTFTMR